jgi:hypothetical protein
MEEEFVELLADDMPDIPDIDDDILAIVDVAIPDIDDDILAIVDVAIPDIDDDILAIVDVAIPDIDDDILAIEDPIISIRFLLLFFGLSLNSSIKHTLSF